jgi:hypothetical protein
MGKSKADTEGKDAETAGKRLLNHNVSKPLV